MRDHGAGAPEADDEAVGGAGDDCFELNGVRIDGWGEWRCSAGFVAVRGEGEGGGGFFGAFAQIAQSVAQFAR